MDKTLIVSDLDGTLLGDDEALLRFADWCGGRRSELVLAYSSGRFCESIFESIRCTALPDPDYILGGVGTQLRRFAGCVPVVDWERAPLERWDPLRVRTLLKRLPELEPQPAEFQSDRKVSYYFRSATAADLMRVRDLLLDAGLRIDLLYSSQRDLDVVPAGINKGSAAAFLAQSVVKGCSRVIVAGDTGNDLMMFLQGFLGVVVANAHRELKDLAGEQVYVSPLPYADGVLDGIAHWLRRPPPPTLPSATN